MELIHSGKVRDVYADGDDLLLVASDRVSIYDVVLPTPVPGKGRMLTQLSLWWFDRLGDIVPNHVISAADVPPEWAGRAIRCQRLEMVPVECIARGYLAGLGLAAYNETGRGVRRAAAARPGRGVEAARAGVHPHHEGGRRPRRADDVRRGRRPGRRAGRGELRRITLEVYRRGAELAAERGIIVADTKLEFGWAKDGTLVLGRRGAHP